MQGPAPPGRGCRARGETSGPGEVPAQLPVGKARSEPRGPWDRSPPVPEPIFPAPGIARGEAGAGRGGQDGRDGERSPAGAHLQPGQEGRAAPLLPRGELGARMRKVVGSSPCPAPGQGKAGTEGTGKGSPPAAGLVQGLEKQRRALGKQRGSGEAFKALFVGSGC